MASDHNAVASSPDSLRLEGMSYPINIRAGKGMAMTGTANAALGMTLTDVQVAVLDENDQTVVTAQASPSRRWTARSVLANCLQAATLTW